MKCSRASVADLPTAHAGAEGNSHIISVIIKMCYIYNVLHNILCTSLDFTHLHGKFIEPKNHHFHMGGCVIAI